MNPEICIIVDMRLTKGKTGYEWRIFPQGIPHDKKSLEVDSTLNNEPTQIQTQAFAKEFTPEKLLHLIKCEGKLEVLERENQFLKDQLSTRSHLDPWRLLIEKTGKLLLFLLSPFNSDKVNKLHL